MIAEEKRIVRGAVRARLASITMATRLEAGQRAAALLSGRVEWRRAQRVMGYLALPDELDLAAALLEAVAAGRTVALPRYLPASGTYGAAEYRGESLAKGRFGVSEPPAHALEVPLKRLDFVLVPGVAFDGLGRRLGRGKGFYDRLLAEAGGVKCGVALDEQLVGDLPSEPHDVSMDFILTPTRWIAVRTGGT